MSDNDKVDYRLQKTFLSKRQNNLEGVLQEGVLTLAQKKIELDKAAALLQRNIRLLEAIQNDLEEYNSKAKSVLSQLDIVEKQLEEKNDT